VLVAIKNYDDKQLKLFLANCGIKVDDMLKEFDKEANPMSALRELFTAQYGINPVVELKKDFKKAVEFCLLCLDRQRILQENGRDILDKLLKIDNWEVQTSELIDEIIDLYSPRIRENS
jgi:hypothetical protein